jgi:hypothetical protein
MSPTIGSSSWSEPSTLWILRGKGRKAPACLGSTWTFADIQGCPSRKPCLVLPISPERPVSNRIIMG